jgi:hypothetical protein
MKADKKDRFMAAKTTFALVAPLLRLMPTQSESGKRLINPVLNFVPDSCEKPYRPLTELANKYQHYNSNHGNYHYIKGSYTVGKYRCEYIKLFHLCRPLVKTMGFIWYDMWVL